MNGRRRDAIAVAFAASLGTAACAGAAGDARPPEPTPMNTGRCDAGAAQFAVGEPWSENLGERAREAAGAARVRSIPFGLMVPMVFEEDRLTLQLDAEGRVESVVCG